MFDLITYIWYYFFANKELREYEKECFDFLLQVLCEKDKIKLEKQYEYFNLVQRPADGIKSLFFNTKNEDARNWDEDLLFENTKMDFKVLEGVLEAVAGDIKAEVKFEIYFHRGRFYSIDFKSSPEFFAGYENFIIRSPKIYLEKESLSEFGKTLIS